MRAKNTIKSAGKSGEPVKGPAKNPANRTRNEQKTDTTVITIQGKANGERVPSRILEERIQQSVQDGARELLIIADGQHGIGGRIWPRGTEGSIEPVRITVEGTAGQRLGSMGMSGTEIVVKGSVSDDVGWLNCGAKITVLGDATNGAFNAAAQGVLYVQGSGGARCDTMTKQNPRFDPPQSWYFRNVGDSFAEFKAGGIAVVCGVNPRNPENVLGYRPCVGMVGGTIYFRGPIQGYSEKDVKLLDLTPQDWEWLTANLKTYLEAIDRLSYYEELTRSAGDWKKLIAYTPKEKAAKKGLKMSTADFRKNRWEAEVGRGGIFAEYLDHELTVLPYITTGKERRNKPVWANEKYNPPCAYACPTHIPSHKRASLIRQGRLQDSLELVLRYSPLPATVCGQICPNLCMESCTRGRLDRPLSIDKLGSLALDLPAPRKESPTGHRVAVIGGGPAGLSAAWQLALKGHTVDLYEAAGALGGKIEQCIPRERLPHEILEKELSRFRELGVNVHLNAAVDRNRFDAIHRDHEIVVVAVGAHKPRVIQFPGSEHVGSAYDFLRGINSETIPDLRGKRIVVIGAGNVGMDVASEAYNCGAESVIAVDIQKPAAFGKEMETATAKGTQILWPKFTERYDAAERKLHFKDGSSLDADMVIMSIGDVPELDFLPPAIHTERGWITVNEIGQTSDVKVFAIGDVTGLGLVTHAIGQGRLAAETIHYQLMHAPRQPENRQVIPYARIRREYYDACRGDFTPENEAGKCMSCASCRDCRMCETTCYWGAISRVEHENGDFEYVVDEEKCIGCGFCAGICPCGIWEMIENI
ncbi:MAG: FAD-dependent oxidoreductase [Alphaproteobacteria bacterium]|uniref:FAD-dependent oxidoreductase n=1 Tax=Candidatus Nitrobium versatile TaxID=2884831 RepID=A0A953J9C8_9BACT|nr:FAD-dependent oxidoreductase [Candidatus Nitrobium versatile]